MNYTEYSNEIGSLLFVLLFEMWFIDAIMPN